MGLLGDIFSTIDSKKRQLRGLLSDPLETIYQGVRNFGADQQGLLDTQARAYPWTGMDNAAKPDLAARKALADAGAAQGMAAATVWHGSPHKFDKFDSSKIGTGEGAQAYGHGLYLAENPKVATDYANRLPDASSPYTYLWNGGVYDKGADKNPVAHALGLVYHQNQNVAKQIAKRGLDDAIKGEPYALEMGGIDYYKKMLETAQQATKKSVTAQQGSLYKVDLPDEHIAKMLDWDKPLSQQAPEVQKAFGVKMRDFAAEEALVARAKRLGVPPSSLPEYAQLESAMDAARPFSQTTGESAYRDLVSSLGTKKIGGQGAALTAHPDTVRSLGAQSATDFLRQAGIPGIRYLDGGSRGAGAGTSNYVVFPGNEDILKILERNGQGLLGP